VEVASQQGAEIGSGDGPLQIALAKLGAGLRSGQFGTGQRTSARSLPELSSSTSAVNNDAYSRIAFSGMKLNVLRSCSKGLL
jgi:hypothetical protein